MIDRVKLLLYGIVTLHFVLVQKPVMRICDGLTDRQTRLQNMSR